jgi:hypothetical protein
MVVGLRHVILPYLTLHALVSHDLQRLKKVRHAQDMCASVQQQRRNANELH